MELLTVWRGLVVKMLRVILVGSILCTSAIASCLAAEPSNETSKPIDSYVKFQGFYAGFSLGAIHKVNKQDISVTHIETIPEHVEPDLFDRRSAIKVKETTISGVGKESVTSQRLGVHPTFYAGYNYRHGVMIYGLELSLMAPSKNKFSTIHSLRVKTTHGEYHDALYNIQTEKVVGTTLSINPKIGFVTFDKHLIYGKLSFSLNRVSYQSSFLNGTQEQHDSPRKTMYSFTPTIGHEYHMARNWLVRAEYGFNLGNEYVHSQKGKGNKAIEIDGHTRYRSEIIDKKIKFHAHEFKVGLSYVF